MNGTQQQAVLAALISASKTLGDAAAALGGSGGAGGNITVPALYLDFLPKEFQGRARDFFNYGVEFLATAGGAAPSDDIAIQNDSDFLVVALTGVVTDPANPLTVLTPAVTLQISNGAGRNMQNRPIRWEELVGTAQLPGYLPYPWFVDRASAISVTATNLTAAQAMDIRLDFWGFKIFGFAQGT